MTYSEEPVRREIFEATYEPVERKVGYRLVPENVIRAALQVCEWHIRLARRVFDLDVSPLVHDTMAALTAALEGKEEKQT